MTASNVLTLLGILTTTAGATWYSYPLGLVVFGGWCVVMGVGATKLAERQAAESALRQRQQQQRRGGEG